MSKEKTKKANVEETVEEAETAEAVEAEETVEENPEDKLKAELEEKNIKIRKTGSIAEASLKLNGVFEAAQNAADQYHRGCDVH